jgi:hypothetical protein
MAQHTQIPNSYRLLHLSMKLVLPSELVGQDENRQSRFLTPSRRCNDSSGMLLPGEVPFPCTVQSISLPVVSFQSFLSA